MSYVPHTDVEREAMLKAVGVECLEDLFACLPEGLVVDGLDVPEGLSEVELSAAMQSLAAKNRATDQLTCFLGAGAYDHFIPAAVFELVSRGELYSAYTPYQPEISQGVLQAIYEYQSMIASLCGCEVANASLYDGATAVVEGVMMAIHQTRREASIILDGALHPHYIDTVKTALGVQGVDVKVVPLAAGAFKSDTAAMLKALKAAPEGTACVVFGYPNFFGSIEDHAAFVKEIQAQGALAVAVGIPFAFGLLTPPGAMGVDIVCGEAQCLGVPLQFGGPYLGYVASTQKLVRRMPGRLVGQTLDLKGQRSFTLTLQAREQHIRRDKATSNICTNSALCAMMAHFYMSCLGPRGLKRAGELCVSKADLLRTRLRHAKGVKAAPAYSVFHEFVYETEAPAARVLEGLLKKGFLGGLDLGVFDAARKHQVLVCVTEKRSEVEIEAYVAAVAMA